LLRRRAQFHTTAALQAHAARLPTVDDLKLNELLRRSFEAYRKLQGD
jgi:hypothetical protein